MKVSKRETILLIIMLIIALVFIDYKFVYVPGNAKYEALIVEEQKVQDQVDEINKLINSTQSLILRKTNTLKELDQVTQPFYNSLKTDALMWTSQDLLVKSGLTLVSIATTDKSSAMIEARKTSLVDLTYQLKKLVNEYAKVAANYGKPSPTPTPAPAGNTSQVKAKEQSNEIEVFSMTIKMSGSYDQLKQFISSIEAMNKSVSISTLSIKSTYKNGIIEAAINVNYYGIQKIGEQSDSSNAWLQPPISTGTGNPFIQIDITPTAKPEPTPTKRP